MRPRVSATRREFSIATAACRAKSSAADVGSARWVDACTEPMAPTSRSPYHRGMRLQACPCVVPLTRPVGAARQLSSELRPAQERTCSAAGWGPGVGGRGLLGWGRAFVGRREAEAGGWGWEGFGGGGWDPAAVFSHRDDPRHDAVVLRDRNPDHVARRPAEDVGADRAVEVARLRRDDVYHHPAVLDHPAEERRIGHRYRPDGGHLPAPFAANPAHFPSPAT